MVDMGDDAEVTDAGDVGHLRGPLAGRSTERKGALCETKSTEGQPDATLRRRDAKARPAWREADRSDGGAGFTPAQTLFLLSEMRSGRRHRTSIRGSCFSGAAVMRPQKMA
jgi:hypothetical protein